MVIQRYSTIRKTAFINAVASAFLAVLKIAIGLIGQSSALVADGIHSTTDLVGDALVLLTAKVSNRHPDKEHPYGHKRIETMAAVVISLLLLTTGGFMLHEAVLRFLSHKTQQGVELFVPLAALLSVIVHECLFRYTSKQGKKTHSPLLIATAWHKRSDAYISLITVISTTLAITSFQFFDAIGAGIIAIVILKTAVRMIRSCCNELLDGAVDNTTSEEIEQIIANTPGVIAVHQYRTRQHGGTVLIDVHIQVSATISVSEGHYISDVVTDRVMKAFDRITDVTVHVDPEDDQSAKTGTELPLRSTLLPLLNTHWHGLPGYSEQTDIRLHYLNNALRIEVVLPHALIHDHRASSLQATYTQAISSLPFTCEIRILYD